MRVPYYDYRAVFEAHQADYERIFRDVASRGAFIMQEDLRTFEGNLARFLNVPFVIGVADGTVALTLSLRAGGIRAGDEVIVPAHTFVASAAAVHHLGAVPVLADTAGRDHLMDPDSVCRKITPKTKAILMVHLNGRTTAMDLFLEMAKAHDLTLFEDAAQAVGSSYKGTSAGSFGVAAGVSFYPSKTLGCFGDGGAVITKDPDVAERIFCLRDHGRCVGGQVRDWGYNARLDNLQAAILDFRLTHYQDLIARRRFLAKIYDERLRDLEALVLPPAPTEGGDHFDIFQNYEIEAQDRDALRAFLSEKGVGTLLPWGGFCLHQFEALGLATPEIKNAQSLSQRFLMLPLHPHLKDEQVFYVCDQIRAFYGGGA